MSEDITRKLHDTTDAQVWAQEFCKLFSIYGEHGEVIDDPEGLMIGWFANAFGTADMHSPYIDRLRYLTESIDRALDELGVPTSDYPAPVANAVRILDDTRKNVGV